MIVAAGDQRLLRRPQLRMDAPHLVRTDLVPVLKLPLASSTPPSRKNTRACADGCSSVRTGTTWSATRRVSSSKATDVRSDSVGSFWSSARLRASLRSSRSSGLTTAGSRPENGPAECRIKRPAVGERFRMLCMSSTRMLGGAAASSAEACTVAASFSRCSDGPCCSRARDRSIGGVATGSAARPTRAGGCDRYAPHGPLLRTGRRRSRPSRPSRETESGAASNYSGRSSRLAPAARRSR